MNLRTDVMSSGSVANAVYALPLE